MSKSLFGLWRKLPLAQKQQIRRWWFEWLGAFDTQADFVFINHGFANFDCEDEPIALEDRDENHRCPIQLYHQLASNVDWRDREGLEISCGRGGGTAYVARNFRPKSLTGIDLSKNAIQFCNNNYSIDGLSFRCGDARSLPFPDGHFDIVLNVESSALYKDMKGFLGEVRRVLKPDGIFLYTDYRKARKVNDWLEQIRKSRLRCVQMDDITAGVAKALALERGSKQEFVNDHVPRFLRRAFSDFAGLKEGDQDEARLFETRKKIYLSFVLRKPKPTKQPARSD